MLKIIYRNRVIVKVIKMKVTQKMPTKRQSKDNWTCKICKREKLETLYFVCPDCIEDVRRNHKEGGIG